MTDDAMNDSAETASCLRCGKRFHCGARDGACWCQARPTLEPAKLADLSHASLDALGLPASARHAAACFCPQCLDFITRTLTGLGTGSGPSDDGETAHRR